MYKCRTKHAQKETERENTIYKGLMERTEKSDMHMLGSGARRRYRRGKTLMNKTGHGGQMMMGTEDKDAGTETEGQKVGPGAKIGLGY